VATVEEFTDPFVQTFTPPPRAGPGVCALCHSWTETLPDGTRREICSSCTRTMNSVSHPAELVVPISLVEVGSQFYTSLSGYKNSQSEDTRARFVLRLGALLARFLRDHGDHIRAAAGADWDLMTIVPSSGSRAGPHPFEDVVRKARAHLELYSSVLEAVGEDVLGHRRSDDRGYRVVDDIEGRRVLLIDDTFTTGARIHSAASALTLAGGEVVAGVTLGRVVHPDYSDEARELWDRQRAVRFDFSVCCLEQGPAET
jgi:predicted amidophosphoribosyltransferase